jgi:hypothetical protein
MPEAKRRRPLPRKDAFFGLHLDLHPNERDTVLGAEASEENVAELLRRVKPDFVQYDCKGHAGYTGYPTRVGWPSPGIVKDALAIWRRATGKRGVGLYIHYSGVWDSVAVKQHPEWARVDADGNPDERATSTFGPYVDELMIPQLREVCGAYDLDGVWADGECWATQLDYAPAALEAWKKETGFDDAPKDRADPRWLAWKMLHRRQFERYLCHWIDALHEFDPRLRLTSNWMYTTFAPKPVVAKLDFLSGDFSPTVSVDRARVEARYLANTGMPWDLMAWGFNRGEGLGASLKPTVLLQQEAGVVLMQGGAFQIYYNPTRSGVVVEQIIETAARVADFCRARQEASHKSTSVPQVALLLSTETQFDRSDAVFAPYGCVDELEGALHALLELHYSVDVLAEHQLQPRLSQFPLVVIPDSYKLAEGFRRALLRYVKQGGRLLLLGGKCARLFASALGARLVGEPAEVRAELQSSAGLTNVNGVWQAVKPTRAKPVAFRHPTRDTRKPGEVAATLAEHGKGRIAAIYGPVALAYHRTHQAALRRFIGDIAARLFPRPAVKVSGPPCMDVHLRRTRTGQLSVHLLNLAEAQRADRFLGGDFIPPVGPIEVEMKAPKRPQRVRWVPDGGRVKWSWSKGMLSVTIPRLELHGVIVVE